MKHLIMATMILSVLPGGLLAAEEYAGKRASLWRPNSMVNTMYADPKARNVNDIVIINVTESSTASNKAGLTTSKKSSSSLGIDAFMGLETELKGKVFKDFDPAKMFGGSSASSNVGNGESTRATALSTYIAARVVDTMPNGNLILEAKKEVMVNKEKQTIVLRGIARPRDISYEGIIDSTRIADMQINFAGKGPVSEQARRGWLSWILSVVWPF
jgi:flagellar L-ring protein FlgH